MELGCECDTSLVKRRPPVKGSRDKKAHRDRFQRLTRRLKHLKRTLPTRQAQVAELVDALLSGSSG